MNDETFLTVFGEVERILNSRTLTHVSDDNHDPNHFLIGEPVSQYPHAFLVTMNLICDGDRGSPNF
jgi:hypothetical protein